MAVVSVPDAAGAVIRELIAGETALAFSAMSELRPHVGSVGELVRRVDDLQRPQGYRLAGAFAPDVEQAAAVAGFRIAHNLAVGHYLYVDDLVTASPYRKRGYARALLDWLRDEAVALGCDHLHLDSATYRHEAHRLYLTAGLDINAFHFGVNVSPKAADK